MSEPSIARETLSRLVFEGIENLSDGVERECCTEETVKNCAIGWVERYHDGANYGLIAGEIDCQSMHVDNRSWDVGAHEKNLHNEIFDPPRRKTFRKNERFSAGGRVVLIFMQVPVFVNLYVSIGSLRNPA